MNLLHLLKNCIHCLRDMLSLNEKDEDPHVLTLSRADEKDEYISSCYP